MPVPQCHTFFGLLAGSAAASAAGSDGARSPRPQSENEMKTHINYKTDLMMLTELTVLTDQQDITRFYKRIVKQHELPT